jgi:hypothetical protein
MQQITGQFGIEATNESGAFTIDAGTGFTASGSGGAQVVVFDSANSPGARTGATTHGADIVEGIKYIIVMKAA